MVKQSRTLNVKNYDFNNSTSESRHGALLPDVVRCIIAGPSGCGKTNVMIALLEHENGLCFSNVYVYSKSLFQPKYEYLKMILEPMKEISYFAYNDNIEIEKPINAKCNSVFIFDDVACNKQNVIREYFSMGRHKMISCFYLCQTYTRIPKHLIRDNVNMLILFKQDVMNLKHVYMDHVNTDMSYEKFKDLCSFCWRDKYGFVVIDKESDLNRGRYRKGFDHYIIISNSDLS